MPNRQLIELRDQQAELLAQARARLDEITDDTDESRAAEIEAEHDRMMDEYDRLGERCARLERVEAAEEQENRADRRRPRGDDVDGDGGGADDVVPPDYRAVFERAIRHGVAALSDEERTVLQRHRPEVTPEMRAQAVGTDSAGGYIVPEGFSGEIDRAMAAWGPMWDANIVRELNTTSGNPLPWPTLDDTANTGELKAENAAVTDDGSDATFGVKTFGAYVYSTKMLKVPMELLADSAFDFEGLINDLFAERLGRLANSVLTTGDGSSKPQGIVAGAAVGKTAAGAAAVTADEIIDTLHSVDPAYRSSPKCRWQFNDSTLSYIRKLKDGQGNYLWQMGDVRTGEPDTLLAHPYSINQAMADIGTGNKPILFGDHSRYVVRKVKGFTVLTLRERYAEYFQIGMVGFKRFDGALLNSAAVKVLQNA